MIIVTGEQMHELDKIVIEQYGLPGIVLMENAASESAREINSRYGPLAGVPIAVVCGKGNNGGDGLAIARHLTARYQAKVTVWLAEPMDKVSADTAANLAVVRNYGIAVHSVSDAADLLRALQSSSLVVDAVLGTGITGDPRVPAAAAINTINQCGRPVVSIDLPSGLNDSGQPANPTVEADLTITLAFAKLGLFLYPGVQQAGKVIVVDISFPSNISCHIEKPTIATDKSNIAAWLPSRTPGRDSNKGKFGAVTLLAGSPGFVGAACLASEGAARTGAGLVTLGVPTSIAETVMIKAVETVMVHAFPSSDRGSFDAGAVEPVLEFIQTRDSVAFGCGAGLDDGARDFARAFIPRCDKPLVIDADALTILSLEPDQGATLVRSRKAPTVLTPHPGEMARLLATDTKAVQSDRLSAVRKAAEKFQAVVLLKGQATLIAHPDGRLAVNTTGNPGMATGGSGDVLTGVTAALLGQIDDPWEATAAAAYLHGLAGDIAAAHNGMAGLLAKDLAANVPAAIRKCYE